MPNQAKTPIALFWFRRDLRLEDNAGLAEALKSGLPVLPIFIFDDKILAALKDRHDARVEFLHTEISRLRKELSAAGGTLLVEHGEPVVIFTKLFAHYEIKAVYLNHDYEPYATERDTEIRKLAKNAGAEFKTFKDQVIFEKLEIEKGVGGPYSMYTPYSRQWLKQLQPSCLKSHESEKHLDKLFKFKAPAVPTLKELGFEPKDQAIPEREFDRDLVKTYEKTRNIPGIDGTSRLGLHLRFGTVSVRELVTKAKKTNAVYLGELIWREFFMQILWNYPNVVKHPFKPKYANIKWRNDKKEFAAWCEGRTGFPIVDAGMRQLNQTGFMHNRVRMITASFMIKHLLIDWRWGEKYFADKLLDFELSSNNGNWQWVAGCGCDSAPYFRVFNPAEQLKKFDPKYDYVRAWVSEYGTDKYPEPMVDHKEARDRVLKVYKAAVKSE